MLRLENWINGLIDGNSVVCCLFCFVYLTFLFFDFGFQQLVRRFSFRLRFGVYNSFAVAECIVYKHALTLENTKKKKVYFYCFILCAPLKLNGITSICESNDDHFVKATIIQLPMITCPNCNRHRPLWNCYAQTQHKHTLNTRQIKRTHVFSKWTRAKRERENFVCRKFYLRVGFDLNELRANKISLCLF